jgi:hypothetical protein
LRLLEDVENDLQELKLKRWRQKASQGEKCTSVIKETKVFEGQYSQRISDYVFILSN